MHFLDSLPFVFILFFFICIFFFFRKLQTLVTKYPLYPFAIHLSPRMTSVNRYEIGFSKTPSGDICYVDIFYSELFCNRSIRRIKSVDTFRGHLLISFSEWGKAVIWNGQNKYSRLNSTGEVNSSL